MLLLVYVRATFRCKQIKNPEFPHWIYTQFDLDKLEDDKCRAEFKFWKNDIYDLFDVLDFPDEIITDNRQNVNKIEALYFAEEVCPPMVYD